MPRLVREDQRLFLLRVEELTQGFRLFSLRQFEGLEFDCPRALSGTQSHPYGRAHVVVDEVRNQSFQRRREAQGLSLAR